MTAMAGTAREEVRLTASQGCRASRTRQPRTSQPCTLLRLHSVEVDVDRHVVAEEDAAVVERFVPVDAVVLAVDGRGQGEAGALVAPRVFAEAAKLDREGDVLRHTVHRQVAG